MPTMPKTSYIDPAGRKRTATGRVETLPNGLRRISTEFGWLYIRPDDTYHSRSYR